MLMNGISCIGGYVEETVDVFIGESNGRPAQRAGVIWEGIKRNNQW